MLGRKLMWICWPAFLAASVLQVAVFTVVDPSELHWAGHQLGWTRQAVYAVGFFFFWGAAILSSALTALLGMPKKELDGMQ